MRFPCPRVAPADSPGEDEKEATMRKKKSAAPRPRGAGRALHGRSGRRAAEADALKHEVLIMETDLRDREASAAPRVGAKERAMAERDAMIHGYVRQAEALGISAVNLINEALLAEIDVRDFERRTGRALEVKRFVEVSRLRRVMNDVEDCERKTGKA